MKLWSGTLSPFSTKVRIALAEKHLQSEIAEIPWSRATLWGPKPAAFLAVSPKGEVPVLEEAGVGIVDSTVINEYLEEAYPRVPLMPTEPLARAECRMWEDMADHFMASHLTVLIREVFMKPDGLNRDETAVKDTLSAYERYLAALERKLSTAEHLCGAFSFADIATWIGLAFARTLGVSLEDTPAIRAWYDRLAARPAFATEFEQIVAAAAAA